MSVAIELVGMGFAGGFSDTETMTRHKIRTDTMQISSYIDRKGRQYMNKVKINICGINYNVTTDNDTDFVMDISAKLDKEIKAILKKNPSLGIQSAAVFCALEAYEERKKSEDSLDNLRIQLKEYMDEAGKLRDARDNAVVEADKLRKRPAAQNIDADDSGELYEEDAEQLVLENTVTPAVTIPVEEKPARDAAPPRPNRAARRSKAK